MRMTTKITALFLAVCILLSFSSCNRIIDTFQQAVAEARDNQHFDALVSEQTEAVQPEVSISESLSPIGYEGQHGYKSLSPEQQKLYDKIHAATLNYHHFIDLRETPVFYNDFLRIFHHYLDDHPEVFWVYRWIDRLFYKNGEDGLLSGILLQYLSKDSYEQYSEETNKIELPVPHEELHGLRVEFNTKINQILELVSVEDEPLVKEVKIFNYIAENVQYDNDLVAAIDTDSVTRPISQNAYGAAVENSTVCSGFAKLFSLLMNYSGVECLTAHGKLEDVPHQWNIIALNGSYYHVDVTNSFISENEIVSYTYLNISDEDMKKSHDLNPEPTDGVAFNRYYYDVPACDSDKYSVDTFFGVRITGRKFDKTDFSQKIKRISDYDLMTFRLLFPPETSEDTVVDYIVEHQQQMENAASPHLTLDHYFFNSTSFCLYIKVTEK